jgi:hypothetical protein
MFSDNSDGDPMIFQNKKSFLQSYGSCLYAGSHGNSPDNTVCRQEYRQATYVFLSIMWCQ